MQVRHRSGHAIAANGWPPPCAPPPRLRSARRAWACFLPHMRFVCVHTVIRWTPNRREIDTTLSPLARAVLIASTWLSVSGVLVRLLGVVTTSGSASTRHCGSSPTSSFACSHAEPSRSNLCQVFGLSPPASTNEPGTSNFGGARFVLFWYQNGLEPESSGPRRGVPGGNWLVG